MKRCGLCGELGHNRTTCPTQIGMAMHLLERRARYYKRNGRRLHQCEWDGCEQMIWPGYKLCRKHSWEKRRKGRYERAGR
jgi:hypothetical protein